MGILFSSLIIWIFFFNFSYSSTITVERNFPNDVYLINDDSDKENSTIEKDEYEFVIAFLPSGALIIILVLLFVCTRKNVCLVKSWVK